MLRAKELKTNRLTLKAISEDSKSDLIAIVTDPLVTKTYLIPDFKSEEEKEAFFLRLKTVSENPLRFVYGIYLSNTFIGFLNEVNKEEDTIEVGYFLSPIYWNKGYATEALIRAIEELFRIGYNHVKAAHFIENKASGRVMQKAGMHLIDEVEDIEYRGNVHHCIYYQIDK